MDARDVRPVTDRLAPREAGRRMVAWGALSLVGGALLLVSPMLLGRGMLIKYIIAVGFLGTCLGIILVLLGAFDWWRGGDRR